MYEQVFPDIYQVVVPLPQNPLKAVNCYVIKTADRDLIIDTGMNRSECRAVMDAAIDALDIDLDNTDLFITHLHADHMGLLSYLKRDSTTVYFNEIEAEMMSRADRKGGFKANMMNFARVTGFSETEITESLSKHPGLKFQAPFQADFTIMKDGDILTVGDYKFECISTPGHSEGHLCLYDAEKKLMFSGDHVLAQISPNISAWSEPSNPLRDYMESLDKIDTYDVELALPGHRRIMRDFHNRVDELKQHHIDRLDEVLSILNGTGVTPYDTASQMKWHIKYDTWEEVDVMQKWFATGEAAAHLNYLRDVNKVKSTLEDGVIRYWA